MFSFKVVAAPGSRSILRTLCEHYNMGRAVIRYPFHRLQDGTIEYTVDVHEPTEYGTYLMGWLDRCEYDKALQGYAVNRPVLHDAWLRWWQQKS
jgi:hypothetical protein